MSESPEVPSYAEVSARLVSYAPDLFRDVEIALVGLGTVHVSVFVGTLEQASDLLARIPNGPERRLLKQQVFARMYGAGETDWLGVKPAEDGAKIIRGLT